MEQSFIYFLLTVLLGLLAWIGNRIHVKIDSLTERLENKLDDVNRTLRGIESELRNDLLEHDKRITTLEVITGLGGKSKHARTN